MVLGGVGACPFRVKSVIPVPPGDVGCQPNNDLDSDLPAGR